MKSAAPSRPPLLQLRGRRRLQVAMPIGGLGAGNVCLNGEGGLQDFSFHHRPHTTALPDGHHCHDTAFALLHLKGPKPVTRLLEGPLPPEKIYDQGLQAQGYRHGGHEGLPRFRHAAFEGEFPFGHVSLHDPALPLRVRVTGFNPFIPRDDKNSGLPCAILEYRFENTSRRPVEFEFSYHLSHPACGTHQGWAGTRTAAVGRRGVFFHNLDDPASDTFGTACLMALEGSAAVKAMWFRGDWFDAMSALWREVSTGRFTTNAGHNGLDVTGRNGGSLLFRRRLAPGASVMCPVVIAWHFPNSRLSIGLDPALVSALPAGGPSPAPAWRPFYAGVWADARAVADYVRTHYASLRARTAAFKDALFASTLPPAVLDAVTANLAILKSPTVLRQENGNLWGWEGCFPAAGCCHGTCTHVWNYAQSLCHLFPALERTLREQELLRSQDTAGHVSFRAALPDGPPRHNNHAAADGQLGGILKLHRDWQISGDTAWLRALYPAARRSLDYCIRTWDPERRGALFEPHHNTYDIEFWGPGGMCTTVYIGALSAMAEIAAALGETEFAASCQDLARRGAALLDRELFNGEYYHQRVQHRGLRDQSFRQLIRGRAASSAVIRLLRAEGPKYQYGDGCLSDGVIGAWMAELYGVATPLNRTRVRATLRAIFRHNFRRDLSTHVNLQRPGYALGGEPGLLLCSWPRGGKPTLPFVYSDEVWTGIEYQVASHLILHGLVREGLTLVRAVRRRYDGHTRNPYNEYECGSYYARAMASYALLPALSGFRYSAVEETLWFGPAEARRPFRTFFSTASGWGRITLRTRTIEVAVIEGELRLKRLVLGPRENPRTLPWSVRVCAGKPAIFTLP